MPTDAEWKMLQANFDVMRDERDRYRAALVEAAFTLAPGIEDDASASLGDRILCATERIRDALDSPGNHVV